MIFSVKTDLQKYYANKRKYGPPQLSAFGRHSWPQIEGEWVRDVVGKIVLHSREVRYLGTKEGLHFYLASKSKLKGKALPSFTK